MEPDGVKAYAATLTSYRTDRNNEQPGGKKPQYCINHLAKGTAEISALQHDN